jgi:hypothetical protein
VNASFTVFRSADVARVQRGFNLLNTLGVWLPVIVLVLLMLGVYVAKDHGRTLVGAGLGVAAGMQLLALGLAVFRSIYLNGVPADVLPHDAAAVLYDTIVRFLRAGCAPCWSWRWWWPPRPPSPASRPPPCAPARAWRARSPGCRAAPSMPGCGPARSGAGWAPTSMR